MLVGAHRGLDRAGLGLAGAEDQARDPRVDHRAHAHLARFDGHVHCGAAQPVIASPSSRVAQRHDLGVRGGVVGRDRLIESLADDRLVDDDDGADGNFATAAGFGGELERGAHERLIHALRHRL